MSKISMLISATVNKASVKLSAERSLCASALQNHFSHFAHVGRWAKPPSLL